MYRDHLQRAIQKLARRAARDEAFACEVRTGPANFARSQLFAEMLDEDELRAVRVAMNYHWAPEVAAHSQKTRAAVKGVYGDAIRKVVAKCREDADFAYDVRTDPFGVLQGGRPHQEVGLTLEETRALKDTSQELWQADVKVRLSEPEVSNDDILRQAMRKVAYHASRDGAFFEELGERGLSIVAEYADDMELSEDERWVIRDACHDLWLPRVLAHTPQVKRGIRGDYHRALHALGKIARATPAFLDALDDDPARALDEAESLGLPAHHARALRSRTPVQCRADLEERVESPLVDMTDLTFLGTTRVQQLIGDVDVRTRTSGFISEPVKQAPGAGKYHGTATLVLSKQYYNIDATQLGTSFEGFCPDDPSQPALIFLFGDSQPFYGNDVLAWSTTSLVDLNTASAIQLTFFTSTIRPYLGTNKPIAAPLGGYVSLSIPYTKEHIWLSPSDQVLPLRFSSMIGDNIPYDGIAVGSTMYVSLLLGYTTDSCHTYSALMQLTASPPAEAPAGTILVSPRSRTLNTSTGAKYIQPISASDGAGLFVKAKFHKVALGELGDPTLYPPGAGDGGGDWVLMFGSGRSTPCPTASCAPYHTVPPCNNGQLCLAIIREEKFHEIGNNQNVSDAKSLTCYYTGTAWSEDEADAALLPGLDPTDALNIAHFSVAAVSLGVREFKNAKGDCFQLIPYFPTVWLLMLGIQDATGTLQFYYAESPLGPWIGPYYVYESIDGYPTATDPGFIYDGDSSAPDALAGPWYGGSTSAPIGNSQIPMLVERYCYLGTPSDDLSTMPLTVRFNMSTYVPYYTTLMSASFAVNTDSFFKIILSTTGTSGGGAGGGGTGHT